VKNSRKLQDKIETAVAEAVTRPEVPGDMRSVDPITESVMEEVQPRIDHLTNAEPWYQSRVTWGAIIIILTRLLAHFGYKIPEELHGAILDLIIAFGPYFGAGVALWGRWVSKKPIGA
jgi:hypothetical protein